MMGGHGLFLKRVDSALWRVATMPCFTVQTTLRSRARDHHLGAVASHVRLQEGLSGAFGGNRIERFFQL